MGLKQSWKETCMKNRVAVPVVLIVLQTLGLCAAKGDESWAT